ncbi:hypothetical protein [Streptomyces herbicida]|uniref:hypothetical protein n=1 Tax=Streptomyces herbicida TaxID=3065675 RepID=UPI00292DA334|nr:hypothetical protein [Streptomyces sp. NEAU-HV9]
MQDVHAVGADLQHLGEQRLPAPGQPVVAHRPAGTVGPLRCDQPGQPALGVNGKFLQGPAQGLGDQLTAAST